MTKPCAKCKEVKPLDDFGKAPRMKLGRESYCRACKTAWAKAKYHADPERARAEGNRRRRANPPDPAKTRRRALIRNYGITPEDFEAMLASQQSRCAICLSDKPGGKYKTWAVDHDHETGRVRGILCGHCNVGLGMFKDDPAIIAQAIAYLEATA